MYKTKDIKTQIYEHVSNDTFSIEELKTMIFDFFNLVDYDLKIKIYKKIAEKIGYHDNAERLLEYFYSVIDSTLEIGDGAYTAVRMLAEELADCSDDEEFCNDKIYIVVKGLSEEVDDVYEFNSWEEAEKDFDERYTSCCDDIFIAENVLFPILSYLREKEADKLMNFCSVIEFDATGLEENRENWEEKWEAGEI